MFRICWYRAVASAKQEGPCRVEHYKTLREADRAVSDLRFLGWIAWVASGSSSQDAPTSARCAPWVLDWRS